MRFENVIKSYSKLLCFVTGRRKLYFSSVGCRNPEKVGKHFAEYQSFFSTQQRRLVSTEL